jgi:MFS family permease
MAVSLATSPPVVSRYTYRYHLRAEILNSLFAGIFGLSEAVARKSLGASDIEIIILTTASAAFALLAFIWGSLMEGQRKSFFILTAALIGRGMLILTALVSGSIWFVLLCCCVFFADPIVAPAQQSLMQSNYDPTWRGRLLGRVVLWTRGFFILSALGAAYLLEHDPRLYRLLFPVAGVIGCLAYVQYAVIRIRRNAREPGLQRPPLSETLAAFKRILRHNRDFDCFERNFFIYGIGFFLVLPANVFLLVDHLGLSYSEISMARLVLFQVTFALFSPLAGRFLDDWKAVRTATASFAVLALYPICLYFAYALKSTDLVYAGFAIFGIAMAGVNSAWNLGAIEFAGRKDASLFMGVHLTAVGVRGLFVPMIGYAVTALFNLGTVYLTASVLFALAALSMHRVR